MRLYDKNMIEMRDGRKPVISPQLKSVSNYIDISLNDIREACEAAFKNHSKKNDVVNFNSDFDGNVFLLDTSFLYFMFSNLQTINEINKLLGYFIYLADICFILQ